MLTEEYNRWISKATADADLIADDIDRNVSIVYMPLNGIGFEPVTRILDEAGFTYICQG